MNENDFELDWGTRIPLRDGVELAALVYRPRPEQGPVPCVVALTPYMADGLHPRGVYFAGQGFAFIAVDVRGRGNSEGTFRPFIQEANDGFDVIEWVARQPFCNGKVAMWGASYLGYAQWATAKEKPPHLATIVPMAAPYLGVDFPMRSNIHYPYLLRWLMFTAARTPQTLIFSDDALWSRTFKEWHQSGVSFRALTRCFGGEFPVLEDWLDHPEPDAFWRAHNPTAEQYAALGIPVLTLTGSYDDDQPGALEHYRNYMKSTSTQRLGRHYLVIGPWDHAGLSMPAAHFGGIQCGPASLLDIPQLLSQWYAWTLGTGDKPPFLERPVAYYVMGAERWRYADTLDSVTVRHEAYFLDSEGNATDVFSSGSLSARPGAGAPDSYRFDPADTHTLEVDAEARADGNSLTDQSVILALGGKSVVYHTAPFEEPIEISGFFRLSVWMAIDCPDTDLYVSVHEIRADGSSIRLSTDALRARYREGLERPKLIATPEPLRYEFDRFTFISRQVARGSRLRLVIAPMGRIIGATFAEKNYNSGGCVAEETVADARPVGVRLFHDHQHPSALYVPLGVGSAREIRG